MPLQNRVTPFGTIIRSPCRGTFMGNRGVLHKNKNIIAPHKTLYWITCVLQYGNIRRTLMRENHYTELFFLDEATSFAAGHRPCGMCRYTDFKRFKDLWVTQNRHLYQLPDKKIVSIDRILQTERLDPWGKQQTEQAPIERLPSGTFVTLAQPDVAYLLYNRYLLEYSPCGYIGIQEAPANAMATVLTPKSMVNVFAGGYLPHIHMSGALLLQQKGVL
jgi:hypothetical protein